MEAAGQCALAAFAATNELIAAVAADIVKTANFAVAPTDHDQRRIDDRKLAHEITAVFRNIGDMADHQPGFFEYLFPFAIECFRRDHVTQWQNILEPAGIAVELRLHECIHGALPT